MLTVPNAHDCDAVHLPSRDSKNLVTMVFMTSLCVDSYEKKKNGLDFVVLKDVPDVYQLKLSLH